ncbi:Ethanolamine utilization protein EutL [uncultured Roseburia sp.]|uniref:Ethanolamine utilization microcompartment protein EutL n=1 Tax=Brotonthovivens ammoniilytica TaxID=2981725 RepID=A0ABT2TF22_9FIRM|nr:ethanolamine utilization microcompartment protein EutL [Brotonthovivens ammoniilytica]MCU6760789.1 ethanolamine utilization microcompartment protein EutL [Brotonthovivens ammoniilytica]SCI09342.1 Ethanolamine utilization protein EutL [uncultured Roseburia sp.]
MKGDQIKSGILSVRYIPNADPFLLKSLKTLKGHNSLGIITTDSDDVAYSALDEATKKADVRVVYAKSMYAGASNASTKLAGEFIGILAGPNPEEVRSGMEAAISFIENDAHFYSANEDDSIIYYAQCISRTGSYLSKQAKIPAGEAIAYLVAPPVEAMVGIDEALKAADVELKVFYGPPTETNFAGALLTGDQAACQAACDAFAEKVCQVAECPIEG